MIRAADALKKPTAQLSAEEKAAVDAIESELEKLIDEKMEFRGVDFLSKESRPNVVAELNQRLKAAGYEPHIEMMLERHPFNAALMKLSGFKLMLAPSDAAYQEARRVTLS